MPAQRTKSAFSAKWGTKVDSYVSSHAKDETKLGFTRLPGGINNGVAQLQECYFDTVKQGDQVGEVFWRAMGVVITPEYVDTKEGRVKVAGAQTSIIRVIAPGKKADGTPITVDDHIAWILNEMRKLGADTSKANGARDMEQLAASLEAAQPFFKFSTSQSAPTEKYPNPRVWENWNGPADDGWAPPEGGGVLDETGIPESSANGFDETAHGNDEPEDEGSNEGGDDDEPSATEESGEYDYDQLAEDAENGDEGAIEQIKQLASEAGLKPSQIEGPKSGSWTDVVNRIREATSGANGEAEEGEEETPEEETAEWEPEKGGVYMHALRDPKTKRLLVGPNKKPLKPVEVTVLTINKRTKTVDVKRNDTKAVIKGLQYAELTDHPDS